MKHRNASLPAGAISLILGLATTGAVAADKNSYAYEGISLTRTTAPNGCKAINHYTSLTSHTCNDTSTRWKVFGGLRLNRYSGFEVTYADLGRAVVEGQLSGIKVKGKSKASGLGLSAVGYLPVDDGFALFAKAGAFRWRVKSNLSASDVNVEGTESGVSFVGGLGASYFFTEELGVRAEYEVIKGVGDKGASSGSDVHVMSVGMMLRF